MPTTENQSAVNSPQQPITLTLHDSLLEAIARATDKTAQTVEEYVIACVQRALWDRSQASSMKLIELAIEKDGHRAIEIYNLAPVGLAIDAAGNCWIYRDSGTIGGTLDNDIASINREEMDGLADALRAYSELHRLHMDSIRGDGLREFLTLAADALERGSRE